jgi:hypothetical protein
VVLSNSATFSMLSQSPVCCRCRCAAQQQLVHVVMPCTCRRRRCRHPTRVLHRRRRRFSATVFVCFARQTFPMIFSTALLVPGSTSAKLIERSSDGVEGQRAEEALWGQGKTKRRISEAVSRTSGSPFSEECRMAHAVGSSSIVQAQHVSKMGQGGSRETCLEA